MFDKIMIPVDGNPACRVVIDYGIDGAVRYGSKITLLNVSDISNIFTTRDIASTEPFVSDQVRANLDYARHYAEKNGLESEELVIRGIPADVIIEQSGNFDIIIMGSAGRKGISRIVLGSVASHVLTKTSCPLMIVNINNIPRQVAINRAAVLGNDHELKCVGGRLKKLDIEPEGHIIDDTKKWKELEPILRECGSCDAVALCTKCSSHPKARRALVRKMVQNSKMPILLMNRDEITCASKSS